ncbi:MAG: adaptor protein MecA [Peptococcaceae bacterium]|nr:adaptor protein MecA [Peptococcaceae bacterium]
MKFNLVNDDKLQIIISKDDMIKRDMLKSDLTPHNPEAQKMFFEILEEAKEACGFQVENNTQLMIEAYPMTGESMLVTVTKLKSNRAQSPLNMEIQRIGKALIDELMEQKNGGGDFEGLEGFEDDDDFDDLPDVAGSEVIYRMETLEDVIQAGHLLKPSYDGDSQLFRYNDAYYLVLLEKEWLTDGGLALLGEYGDRIAVSSVFFAEHGQMVMAERALEILAAL